MSSKGSNTTTNNTSASPTPQAMSAYQNVLNTAQGVAATPYNPYSGELVAPVNAEQNQGITGVNTYANAAQPALAQASGLATGASNPLTASQIQNYYSPYQQDVINSTQAQFSNQNQQQQQQVTGNAIAQGALGGNRTGVAAAELANQQQLAQAPVIAGLENQGYNSALTTAAQQYQQNPMAAAGLIGNLGVAGQTAGLTGAGAQLGAGGVQQTTQQALDTALLQQYQQQQAYPFQTTQWLAGIDTGVGSQMGGTTTGQTTAPAPSLWGQILGAGTAATGALGQSGAFGGAGGTPGWIANAFAAKGGSINYEDFQEAAKKAYGGGVVGYAPGGGVDPYSGGTPSSSVMGVAGHPWATAPTYVPTMNITHGSLPHASAPAPYNPPQQNIGQQAASVGNLAKTIKDAVSGNGSLPYGSNVPGAAGPTSVGGAPLQGVSNPYYGGGNAGTGDAYGGNASAPIAGLSASDYGAMAKGGGIRGFADGGTTLRGPQGISEALSDWAADNNLPTALNKNNLEMNPVGVNALARAGFGVAPSANARVGDTFDAINARTVPGFADGGSPDDLDQGIDTTSPATFDQRFPVGLAGPVAMDDWRNGVDQSLNISPKILADNSDITNPTPSTKTAGVANPVQAMAYSDDGSNTDLPPEVALGYSGEGSKGLAPKDERLANEKNPSLYDTSSSPGVDLSSNGKLWPSLLSAGFGMMASRSPFLGNAIGEGGQAGIASYNRQQEEQLAAQQKADQLALQKEQIERPYSEMTAAQKAADQRAKEEKIPFGWTKNDNGTITPIKGGPQDPTYLQKVQDLQKTPFGWTRDSSGAVTPIKGGPTDPAYMAQVRDASGQPKWTPVGTVIEGDTSHPAIMNAVTGEVRDSVTGKPPSSDAKFEAKGQKIEISDTDAKELADYVVKTGDFSRLQGLGYSGSNRVKVNHYIAQSQAENGVTNEDMATKRAEFEGRKAGQRTLGVQEAKMGSAAIEAQGAIQQARGVIERLPRTSFLPFNQLIQGMQRNTLNPDQAELAARTQAIINTYAAVMARGANITTDSARSHGEALLNTAGDPETYNRTLDTMLNEIELARTSPARMREYYAKLYGAKSLAPDTVAAPPTTTTPPTHPAGAVGVRKDTSGRAWYVDSQGKPLGPAQ